MKHQGVRVINHGRHSSREVAECDLDRLPPLRGGCDACSPAGFRDQVGALKVTIEARGFEASGFRYFLDRRKDTLLVVWSFEPSDDHPSPHLFDKAPEGHLLRGYMITHAGDSPSLKFALGDTMVVCTNGLSMGEAMSYVRTGTVDDLNDILRGLGGLLDEAHVISNRQYRDWRRWYATDLGSRRQANDLLVMAADARVIDWGDVPGIRAHWLNPEHHEFKDRNLGNMVHAFTSHQREMDAFKECDFSARLRRFIYGYERALAISGPDLRRAHETRSHLDLVTREQLLRLRRMAVK